MIFFLFSGYLSFLLIIKIIKNMYWNYIRKSITMTDEEYMREFVLMNINGEKDDSTKRCSS